jgi:hypothetical protein
VIGWHRFTKRVGGATRDGRLPRNELVSPWGDATRCEGFESPSPRIAGCSPSFVGSFERQGQVIPFKIDVVGRQVAADDADELTRSKLVARASSRPTDGSELPDSDRRSSL